MRAGLAAALLLLAGAARATTFTLAVTTAGPVTPLVVVTSTPSGIQCPGVACSASFASGTVVELGAVWPSTVAFIVWAGTQGCGTNEATCLVSLTQNSSVTARFDPLWGLAFSGTGLGAVSSSNTVLANNSVIFGSTADFVMVSTAGAVLVLTESTGTASTFVGWSGDAGCSTASTCTITLNGYEVITATFAPDGVGPYPLQVVVPNGGGAVVSTPAGINTRLGVYSSTFTANSTVHLATVAAAGYAFAGWANGGCAGKSPCVVTSSTPLQGLGGKDSPAAYFYPVAP